MSSLKHPMGRIIVTCIIFSLFAAISGCGRKEASEPVRPKKEDIPADKILARVGDEIITVDDYKKEFALLPPEYKSVQDLPKSQFLDILINKRLLLAEAKKRGLQNTENVKKLFQRVKEEIIIQELIDQEVSDKAEVTPGEIEEHYNKNKAGYTRAARTRASHILVDSEQLAKKVLSELKLGFDFADLAKKYSLDAPTRDKGGDLGYFPKGSLFVEFEEACEKLDIGEVSDPVKTGLGHHIIKVTDRKEPSQLTLEETEGEIRRELELAEEISLYENLLQELKEKQGVSINKELLEEMILFP